MIENNIENCAIPQHIAIIMDGNGRWAESQGKERTFGHENGVESVREAIKGCMEAGVKYLTLYAFSTENWNRPKEEVDFLMNLLVQAIVGETPELLKNDIRLKTIGDITALPIESFEHLEKAKEETSHCNTMTLVLALNYGSKKEILNAIKKVVTNINQGDIKLEDLDELYFSNHLDTAGIPDPEIMIRTSNEMRISNFLLWQLAYTELFFLPIFWPEFKRSHIHDCVKDFQNRERRFGKTSAQLV